MAKPGVRTCDTTPSTLEPKLRRIVSLLARAEARAWLATARNNDHPDHLGVPSLPSGATAHDSEAGTASDRAPEGGLSDRVVTQLGQPRTR